jgi:hypothetical protein
MAPTLDIDDLVAATPRTRDRSVDLLRAVSIGVVILWHWVFSVTHVDGGGAITMPNPIGDVRLMWLATWLLQIMPVFFFVGGFANLASIEALERSGDTRWTTFAGRRLARLLRPIGAFLAVWVAIDVTGRLFVDGYTSVLEWGRVVFVPLWFIGMYAAVLLLAPFTARLHRIGRESVLVGMGAAIVLADLGRFRFGVEQLGLVNAALVWLFAHQLGYFWRDGTFTGWPRRRLWTMAGAGLTALVVLTNLGVYPRSMVAVRGEAVSNMFPTTACIAALAVFQAAVVMLLRPAAERWLARRRVWKAVISVNAVAMTLFTWHMTALVTVFGLARLAGFVPPTEPTAAWWLQRPFWLVGPGLLLALLLRIFARVELGRRVPARIE